MAPTDRNDKHRRVWESLPLYANGTLSGQETAQVEAHIASCSACAQELARCRALSLAMKSGTQDVWQPSPRHWAEVLAAVEATETRPGDSRQTLIQRLYAWLHATPRPVRLVLAAQAALIVILTGAVVVMQPPQIYATLSRGHEESRAPGVSIRMVFAEGIAEREVRELLQSIEGSIIQGPSPLGAYTVELRMADTTSDHVDRVLVRIRAHPKVRLAELVDSRSTR